MFTHLKFVTTTVLCKNQKYCEFPTQFQKITDTVSLFQCNVNGTSRDLRVTGWSVAETQYFQAAYFAGSFIMQLPGGYLATRFSPRRYIMYMYPLTSPVHTKTSYHCMYHIFFFYFRVYTYNLHGLTYIIMLQH